MAGLEITKAREMKRVENFTMLVCLRMVRFVTLRNGQSSER